MTQVIKGRYLYSGSTEHCAAVLYLSEQGQVQLYAEHDQSLLIEAPVQSYQVAEVLPGLPADLLFDSGAVFSPADHQWRWPKSRRQNLTVMLETNKSLILLSVIAVPVLIWWLSTVGLPKAATALVPWIPVSVEESIGQQSMQMFDRTLLSASELSPELQQSIRHQWHTALMQLNLTSGYKYQLNFRSSERLGANAFALPGDFLTITDELVRRLEHQPDAILAVLLHEVGHVEQRHGMQLAARATASTIVMSVLFSDLEGVTEAILGTGTSLVQSAFSRDMERQADHFSTQSLLKLNKSPKAFVEAMQALTKGLPEEELVPWLEYLKSHPDTKERIEKALQQAQP
jgi:Zn-dependent protease with chaperone function